MSVSMKLFGVVVVCGARALDVSTPTPSATRSPGRDDRLRQCGALPSVITVRSPSWRRRRQRVASNSSVRRVHLTRSRGDRFGSSVRPLKWTLVVCKHDPRHHVTEERVASKQLLCSSSASCTMRPSEPPDRSPAAATRGSRESTKTRKRMPETRYRTESSSRAAPFNSAVTAT